MAGMFSMLHNSHVRLDSLGNQSSLDEGDRNNNLGTRSPSVATRRSFAVGPSALTTSDQVPKKFRKQRCNEIHPLLRRSVCTLIIAIISLATGVTIILIKPTGHEHQQVTTTGIVFLSIGVVLILVGIGWFYWSKKQLNLIEKKLCEIRRKQLIKNQKCARNFPGSAHNVQGRTPYKFIMMSTCKWPVKKVNIAKECSESVVKLMCEITTPNGSRKPALKNIMETPTEIQTYVGGIELNNIRRKDFECDAEVPLNYVVQPLKYDENMILYSKKSARESPKVRVHKSFNDITENNVDLDENVQDILLSVRPKSYCGYSMVKS